MSPDDEDPSIVYSPDPAQRSGHSAGAVETHDHDTYAPGFEKDHRLRSDFIRLVALRQLDRDPAGTNRFNADEPVPRTLVRYWHDPNDLPSDVRECLATWDGLVDEGVSLRMFDRTSAAAFIGERYGPREVAAFQRCEHPAMQSDYLRMCFVLGEGGLYVDADDVLLGDGWREVFSDGALKVQPLGYDLVAGAMVPESELRRADLPTDGRVFYVNNNPLAASAGHPILQAALERATNSLLRDDLVPDIQATTGPGNLTSAVAAHARALQTRGDALDFTLLVDWGQTATPCWDLEYRNDYRNWRNVFPH